MIPLETRINAKNEVEEGYFLTMEQLKLLIRSFQADLYDGFVSNNERYIERWLKKQGE